jgi:hypothetical protein
MFDGLIVTKHKWVTTLNPSMETYFLHLINVCSSPNEDPTPENLVMSEQIRNPVKEANGTVEYASGSKYKGGREKGRKHGNGRVNMDNGDYYEGTFEHGKREGYGKYIHHDKQMTYDGEWKAEKRNGFGR